jgi:hypothetical protein
MRVRRARCASIVATPRSTERTACSRATTASGWSPEFHLPRGGLLRERPQIRIPAGHHRIPDRQRNPMLKPGRCPHGVDKVIHPRHPVTVGPVQAAKPQHGPLDRCGGVRLG